MKRVAIVQSSYIPWKGYFDLIGLVDEFVLYDDVQFTRRDWRNRNLIKTPAGLKWLTVPVQNKGNYLARICDMRIEDPDWGRSHWGAIRQNYAKAPYFARYAAAVEAGFVGNTTERLSDLNRQLIELLCGLLGIETPLSRSEDLAATGAKSERLLQLCLATGATTYLSGPSARDYLDVALFGRHGITVEWMDYGGYPEYPQLFGPFQHGVTALDLLFNAGPDARRYMKIGPRP